MALSFLLDTSVLTRTANPLITEAIRRLAVGARLARCSMSDLEVGFSARNETEWTGLMEALDAFALVMVTAADFPRAGQVQRALAGAGLKGRKVPDLLIASAAERKRMTVLHYDRDFELIAGVTGQPHQWIVEPGTID